MPITWENRKRFEKMGYEQVHLDLLRDFDGSCKIEGDQIVTRRRNGSESKTASTDEPPLYSPP
jgi:hypothetical protein